MDNLMRRSLIVLRTSLLITAITLSACGGGSSGEAQIPDDGSGGGGDKPPVAGTPVPTPDTLPNPALPAASDGEAYAKAIEASRFLQQASFGATAKSIDHVSKIGFSAWIDEQMALPQTVQLELLLQRYADLGLVPVPAIDTVEEEWIRELYRSDIWWESAIWGEDQLRQRVAYSLSQILVISNAAGQLFADARGVANYQDLLSAHAFGNYRDLLEAVTLNPMMGEYLSMVRNEKADPSRNVRPDENYAREIMQLFTIGLVELNLDGSVKLDGQGQAIPTYGQEDVKALARVFTGWNLVGIARWEQFINSGDSEILPMQAWPEWHDSEAKLLFGSHTIEAGLTPQQDIDAALDILFNHPNVGPFISKQLIQRLVTSNPSPAYVARVASVFNANEAGVRGDLGAVVKAILLDEEARNLNSETANTFGKLREPILKVSALWRAFRAQGFVPTNHVSTYKPTIRARGADRELAQRPYGSFSVFNFYRPDYRHNGAIANAGLVAPEFEILTESAIIAQTNFLSQSIFWREHNNAASWDIDPTWDVMPPNLNLEDELALAQRPADLLDRLDLLLTAGSLNQSSREIMLEYLEQQPTNSAAEHELLVFEALFLLMASPDFAVQQ